MRRNSPIRAVLTVLLCGLVCLAAESAKATTPPKKSPSSGTAASKKSSTAAKKSAVHKKKRKGKTTSKKRGQKAIDSERTQQIQEALIREHYLNGEPSGKWDDATQSALRRYQADHGWQNKTVPDSRALIKLGLGPSHDHLLNPETAMTSVAADPKPSTKPASVTPPAQPGASSDTTIQPPQ